MTIRAISQPAATVHAPAGNAQAGPSAIAAVDCPMRPSAYTGRRAVPYQFVLVIGLLVVAATAWLAASSEPSAASDASFARLMRVMAMIKALLVVIAAAALWWRLARPISALFAAGYLLGASLMVAATVFIWQLSTIGAAALMFHTGELWLLFLAWRDTRN